MKKIKVKLFKNSYHIFIGNNSLKHLPKLLNNLFKIKNAIIITNPSIKKIYSKKINQAFKNTGYSLRYLTVPASEKSKSFKYFFSAVTKISKLSGKKPVFIIALGGGVIGDLAGFVACVYKRGVPYIQIPTTLLAQTDSAIGGKTAIDLTEGKNLVGAFYQPSLVFSDISFLKTLSRRQFQSGLAEIIKYGIIMDSKMFSYIDKNYKNILARKQGPIEHVVYRSSLNKAKIIRADEKETKGIRTILNFGHTIGHAIEAASRFKKYSHGEAISVGMVCAADISCKLGLIKRSVFSKIADLLTKVGLPVKIKNIKSSAILKALAYDKKFIHGVNRFVLVKKIGKALVREKIDPEIIKEAVRNASVS